MGKKQNKRADRRRRARVVQSAMGVQPDHSTLQPSLIAELRSSSSVSRSVACSTIATLAAEGATNVVEKLVSGVVRPLMGLLLDPSSTHVRASAAAALRNISSSNYADARTSLLAQDVLSPAWTLLTQTLQQLAQPSATISDADRTNLCDVLTHLMSMFAALAEVSDVLIERLCSDSSLLNVIFELMAQPGVPADVSLETAKFLHIVSEDNQSMAAFLQGSPAARECLLRLTSEEHSKCTRVLACGILFNASSSCGSPQETLSVIFPVLVNIINIQPISTLHELLAIAEKKKQEEEDMAKQATEDDSSSPKHPYWWSDFHTWKDHIVAAQISFEILTNVCSLTLEEEQADLLQLLFQSDILSKCLALLTVFPSRDACFPSSTSHTILPAPTAQSAMELCHLVYSRSLSCMSNLLMLPLPQEVANKIPAVIDHLISTVLSYQQCVTRMSQSQSSAGDLATVQDSLPSFLSSLHSLYSSNPSIPVHGDLLKLVCTTARQCSVSPEAQVHAVRLLGVFGQLAQCAPHGFPILSTLLEQTVKCADLPTPDQLDVMSAAGDSLIDVLSEDSRFVQLQSTLKLVPALKENLPRMDAMVNRCPEEHCKQAARDMLSNLVAFVEYKEN